MSENIAYYKSSGPEVMEFLDEWKRRVEAFRSSVDEFLKDYPDHRAVTSKIPHREWLSGLTEAEASPRVSPGEHWQIKSGEWFWTPTGKTKEGKKLRSQMKAILWNDPELPGMPSFAFSGTGFGSPGVEHLEGAVYVKWSEASVESVKKSPDFNASIWERIKPSEYWLVKEQSAAI